MTPRKTPEKAANTTEKPLTAYHHTIIGGEPEILVMFDRDYGEHISASDDISGVLTEIKTILGGRLPPLAVYRNKDGEYHEIRHEDGRFIAEEPIGEQDLDIALSLVRKRHTPLLMIERRYGHGNRDWLHKLDDNCTWTMGARRGLVFYGEADARAALARVAELARTWTNGASFNFAIVHDRRQMPAYIASREYLTGDAQRTPPDAVP